MFNVYRLNDEGQAILLGVCSTEDLAIDAVYRYSEKYPNAIVSYIYSDEWISIEQVTTC